MKFGGELELEFRKTCMGVFVPNMKKFIVCIYECLKELIIYIINIYILKSTYSVKKELTI